jgi:hypothetical protein
MVLVCPIVFSNGFAELAMIARLLRQWIDLVRLQAECETIGRDLMNG